MNNSLLALAALATVSAGACAQSSVTLYGKIDLGLVLDSGAAQGRSLRIASGVANASRLGFKGSEDLGGGAKAAFVIETGYCADSAAPAVSGSTTVTNYCSGNNAFMGRQAHGDLSGAFGTMSAGRQYSLGYLNLSAIDPFSAGYSARANNVVDPSATRLNNSFQYRAPAVAGVVVAGEFALGEQLGNWSASREAGAGLSYASGPAYLGASWFQVDNANGQGVARRNVLLGGTWDFGVARAHALVQKSTGSPTGAPALDVLEWLVGASVPLAGGSLMASFVHHDDRGVRDQDANQLGVGYNYPLSKRTSIYSSFARIVDRNGAPFLVGNQTETGTGGKSFDFGVLHSF